MAEMGDAKMDDPLRQLTDALFLAAPEGQVRGPVVTLLGDPANVFPVLERYFRQESLPSADKFWRNVRDARDFVTWRPRVSGVQLKMLQHARLPYTDAEWDSVQFAATAVAHHLQAGHTAQDLVTGLRMFTSMVEQWWVDRRRTDASNVQGAKRPFPSALHGGAKRAALDGVQPGVLNMPLQLAFGHPHMQLGHSSGPHLGAGPTLAGANGSGELGGFAMTHAQLPHVASMPGLADQINGVPRLPSAPSGSGNMLISLNVGGANFSTTVPTLAAVETSFFAKLALKAQSRSKSDFFIDRSGDLFHFVLDHLRSQRYGDAESSLPTDAASLELLAREAAYYNLPALQQRASAALQDSSTRTLVDAPAPGKAHPESEEVSAIFVETGFQQPCDLPAAHTSLLERLNATVCAQAFGQALRKMPDLHTHPCISCSYKPSLLRASLWW